MAGRYSKGGELQQLQYEITNEIARDAPEIARGVFGNNARHPDMSSISNAEIDQLYRQKYLTNDRKWLMQEAQRDPTQFLAVTDRIGVPDPQQGMDGKPIGVDPAALDKMAQNAAPPAVPPPMTSAGPGAGPVPSPGPAPAALPGALAPTGPIQPPLPGMV